MNIPKNIIRFWGFFCVILVVSLGAITVAHRWHRIFPSDEVSAIYSRYEHVEGIDVSFVKKFKVNDTVFVDATLIETKDTSLWNKVCLDLQIPSVEQIPEEFRSVFVSDKTFEYKAEKDSTLGGNTYLWNLMVFSRKNMTICFFHSMNEKQYDAILDKEIFEISY